MAEKEAVKDAEPKVKLYRFTVTEEIEAVSIEEARKIASERAKKIDDKRVQESVARVVRAKYSSRADRLSEAENAVENAKSDVEDLNSEMEEWRDSIPENLQGSDKYSEVESAVDALEELLSNLESCDFGGVEFPGMF